MNFLPITIAAILYATFGIFNRLLEPYFGPFSQGVFRFIILLPVVTILFFAKSKFKKIAKPHIKNFIFLGLFSFLSSVIFFLSSTTLTLGMALFLFYAAFTLVSYAYGYILFQEKPTLLRIISLLLACIGLFIIFNVSLGKVSILNLLIGFAAGASFALYTASTKTLSKIYPKEQITFLEYIQVFPLFLLLTIFIPQKTIVTPWSVGVAGVFGLLQIATSLLTVVGFRKLDAQRASLILLLDPILATILGIFLYGENMSAGFIVGAVFILVAMILSEIKLKK